MRGRTDFSKGDAAMKRTMILLAAMGSTVSGCAFRPELERVAVDQNQLVANVTNETTLLNILRARDYQPMHFTTFSELSGNVEVTMSGEASLALPSEALETAINGATGGVTSFTRKKAIDTATPKFGSTFATKPSFKLQVHSNEKFQRGIMQPISEHQIDYFLQLGWPPKLIAALFIERIDFVSNDGKNRVLETLYNDPESNAHACDFADFIREYEFASNADRSRNFVIGPLAGFSTGAKMGDYSSIDGKALDLVGEGTTADPHKLVRKRPDVITLSFKGVAAGGEPCARTKSSDSGKKIVAPPGSEWSVEALLRSDMRVSRRNPTLFEIVGKGEGRPVITTRSTQGIIYFVGEYMRERSTRYLVDDNRTLFDWTEGEGTGVVSAKFDGMRYFIPRGSHTKSRSLQVIDLLQQLLNLHKSADDLPISRSVTLTP